MLLRSRLSFFLSYFIPVANSQHIPFTPPTTSTTDSPHNFRSKWGENLQTSCRGEETVLSGPGRHKSLDSEEILLFISYTLNKHVSPFVGLLIYWLKTTKSTVLLPKTLRGKSVVSWSRLSSCTRQPLAGVNVYQRFLAMSLVEITTRPTFAFPFT